MVMWVKRETLARLVLAAGLVLISVLK